MITTSEVDKKLSTFIETRISGVDDLVQKGRNSHIPIGGIEFLLISTQKAIKPAADFIKEIKEKGKQGTPSAVLLVRNTPKYDGELLRPAVYIVDGKNRYYNNKKELTLFEQALVELYGPLPYYNPSENCIQVIRFIRTYRIPTNIKLLKDSQDPKERQKFHIHENLREKRRKISIIEKIKGPFTLEAYKRSTKPLVARIIPYEPQ
jgi:hypothetical protein